VEGKGREVHCLKDAAKLERPANWGCQRSSGEGGAEGWLTWMSEEKVEDGEARRWRGW